MDLLDLYVKISAKDEASQAVDDVSQNIIGKLGKAATTAAKALAGMWAVKKVVEFGKAAFDSYAQFEQLQGGVAKLYGNANMQLDEYISSMEGSGKSVDELTKAYERNEEAQKLMMQQASEAWKTAGVDANSYMEQATSMSAALINSLGGDTVKAAKQTDVAMKAISDNVNTFGTDMGSVSQAFMGFSKQNYTMLDNLKLGYGGTKTEMERLIKDANEWGAANGKASNLSIESFSDVVTAIEQIQEKQGIAGTTAKEAMTTIEGSMNATKAAWSNLVTEFGKPDADIGARISDMFTAIMGENGEGGLARNVINEVGVIATNMVNAVGQGVKAGFDWLTQNGPQLVGNALNSIEEAMLGAMDGLQGLLMNSNPLESLFSNVSGVANKVTSLVSGIASTIQEKWPEIQSAAEVLFDKFVGVVTTYGPTILSKIGSVLGDIGNAILEHGPELQGAAAEAFYSLMEWVTSNGPALVNTAVSVIGNLVDTTKNWLVKNGPAILDASKTAFGNIITALVEHGPKILSNIGNTIGLVIGYIINAAPRMLAAAVEFMGGFITGTSEEGKKVRKWFADFFPDGLLKGLGDFGKFLLDTGKALINGLIDGIEEVAPDVAEAIRAAFDTVLEFFSGVGEFLKDPVGSIKNGLDNLMGAFDDTDKSVAKSTGDARDNIGKLNNTKLESKKATATVDGNAQDGKAKKAVEETSGAVQAMQGNTVTAKVEGNATDGKGKKAVDDTNTAVKNLSGKTVTVKAEGNAVDGSAKTWVDRLKDSIRGLSDKTVNVRTNQTTVVTKLERAEGGIRKHATGDIMVANRRGLGVPLDIVGEAGPEAIVPLTSRYGREFAEMMGKEAANVMSGMADGNRKVVNVYLTYNANEDATELVRDIADELSLVL